MANGWYYISKGERQGPVSPQKLKELADLGVLGATDHVWKEGMADWVHAAKVKGLFANPPQTPPPPPQGPPRREVPISIKTEVPIKVVTPREGTAQKVAKWAVIGWSLFCLFGVFIGVINAAANSTPAYDQNAEAGQAIGIGCGLAIWLIIWAVIVGPSLVIWLLTRKT